MRQTGSVNLDALRRRSDGAPTRIALDAGAAAESAAWLTRPGASAWDEAAFLLTAAAEIEHALMVQYLFGAYSLDPDGAGDKAADVERLQRKLLQIAREEMGHLVTVENLLVAIGAPMHFGREHSPNASELYPFRFRLEALSLASLAKYVVAESPDARPEDIPGLEVEDQLLLGGEIAKAALASNEDRKSVV